MKEYDYENIVVEPTKKTFVNEDQKIYSEVFLHGIDVGNGKTILKGNPFIMQGFMSYEREREKAKEDTRKL